MQVLHETWLFLLSILVLHWSWFSLLSCSEIVLSVGLFTCSKSPPTLLLLLLLHWFTYKPQHVRTGGQTEIYRDALSKSHRKWSRSSALFHLLIDWNCWSPACRSLADKLFHDISVDCFSKWTNSATGKSSWGFSIYEAQFLQRF